MGEARTACSRAAGAVSERSSLGALSRGKLCWGPRERTRASSLAAAWSSKSKVAQNFLRSARPKPLLIRPPRGAWTTICMPAGLVEEALEDDVVGRGQDAELAQAGGQVVDQLAGVGRLQAAGLGQVGGGRLPPARRIAAGWARMSEGRPTAPAQEGDLFGELLGPARGLAHPEGDGGMGPFGVGHPDLALGHPADPPGVGAQEKDVAHHRLDGEVLVDRPHRGVVGIEDDPVVAHLGDGPAGGEGGQAGAAAGTEDGVDPVAVEIGHPLAPAGGDPLGGQLEDVLVVGRRRARRRGRPGGPEPAGPAPTIPRPPPPRPRSAGPGCRGGRRGDGWRRAGRPGRRPGGRPHSTSSSRVEGKRIPSGVPWRVWLERPTRWSMVAMARGEPTWQTSSTGPMSIPSSSEAVATRARRSPARRRVSTRWRRSFERLPWWAATWSGPEPLGQEVGQALGEPAGVDEDQGGPVVGGRARRSGRRSRRTARWRPPPRARSRGARWRCRAAGRGRSRRWPWTVPVRRRSRAGPSARWGAGWPRGRSAGAGPRPGCARAAPG